MPQLVQQLVIGSVSTTVAAPASIQKCQAKPLSIAAVSHSGTPVQFGRHQNRVVAISTSHPRINIENGSRLAEALAGNLPYSYATTSAVHISPTMQATYAPVAYSEPVQPMTVTQMASNNVLAASVLSTHRYSKAVPRQTYQLPLVLQDHNYGAPPPATPPHSPSSMPHVTVTPSQLNAYKTQKVGPSSSHKLVAQPVRLAPENIGRKVVVGEQILYPQRLNSAPAIAVTTSGNTNTAVHTTPSPTSQFMATMPLHQQQFMPQPKTLVFSPPHRPQSPEMHVSSGLHTGGTDTDDESRLSDRSSASPSGEETETAPEGEGDEMSQQDDSITRCVCDLTHDDGYMIQCDRCYVWQHVDCMEIDRANIPEDYLCEACNPRAINKGKARTLQLRRMQEIRNHIASRMSSSDSEDNAPVQLKNRPSQNKPPERKVLKKKKTKIIRDAKLPRKVQPSRKSSNPLPNGVPANAAPLNSINEVKEKPIKLRRRSSALHQEVQEETSHIVTKERVSSWTEDYAVAVTNHYSPELRARVQSARINVIPSKFFESTDGAIMGHRCKVATFNSDAESKILVSTMKIKSGTAILEYQGKYMLQSQWNAMQITHSLPYLPFVVKYNMVKEGLPICVDARTYGNDARFARRSTKFNAEMKHVLKRGSVHLYIVAHKDLEQDEEIVLSMDTAICLGMLSKGTRKVLPPTVFEENQSSNNDSLYSSPDEATPPRKNGLYQTKKTLKRTSFNISLPLPLNRVTRRTSDTCEELVSLPLSPIKQRRLSGVGNRSPVKSPVKSPPKAPKPIADETTPACIPCSPSYEKPPVSEDKKDEAKPLSREERKLMAYVKAFERMEKLSQRRIDSKKRKSGDKFRDDPQSSMEEDEGCSADDSLRPEMIRGRKRGQSQNSPHKTDVPDGSESPEKSQDYPYSAPCSSNGPFRFPKTKKSLMNEWLNETVDPVLPTSISSGLETSGVPSCYMRCPSLPYRRLSGPTSTSTHISTPTQTITEVTGTSAKKRWLRQAIIDETEPFNFCSSPSSRPESPNGSGDYTTPLKKRRLARESMSSEHSCTPPNTPGHPGSDEEKVNTEEIEQRLKSGEELPFEIESRIPLDETDTKPIVKTEYVDEKENCLDDKLTINISSVTPQKNLIKLEEDSPKKSPKKSPRKSVFKTKQFGSRKRKTQSKPTKRTLQPTKLTPTKKQKSNSPPKSITKNNSLDVRLNNEHESRQNHNFSPTPTIEETDIIRNPQVEYPVFLDVNDNRRGTDNMIPATIEGDLLENLQTPTNKSEQMSTITLQSNGLQGIQSENDVGSDPCFSEQFHEPGEIEYVEKSNNKILPVKRKLSILEYRKRKSISSEQDCREIAPKENGDAKPPPVDILSPNFVFETKPPLPAICETQESLLHESQESIQTPQLPSKEHKDMIPLSPTHINSISFTPPSPQSPNLDTMDYTSDHAVEQSDVKWNAAPTLLEQQRENLSARLRREFGLCVRDEDETKAKLVVDRLSLSSSLLGHSSSVGQLERPTSNTPPLNTYWGASIESELQRPPSPFQIARCTASPVMKPKTINSPSPRLDPRNNKELCLEASENDKL